jgi:hypothetical protein
MQGRPTASLCDGRERRLVDDPSASTWRYPETASELVTAAETAGIRVLGVDGFLVSPDGIQPLQEMEVDVDTESLRRDAVIPKPGHGTGPTCSKSLWTTSSRFAAWASVPECH